VAREEKTHGHVLKFVVRDPAPDPGYKRLNVRVYGDLAVALDTALRAGHPDIVAVEGELRVESFTKEGRAIEYAVVEATKVETPDWTLPGDEPPKPVQSAAEKVDDLDQLPF
jgi:hypothetical protein